MRTKPPPEWICNLQWPVGLDLRVVGYSVPAMMLYQPLNITLDPHQKICNRDRHRNPFVYIYSLSELGASLRKCKQTGFWLSLLRFSPLLTWSPAGGVTDPTPGQSCPRRRRRWRTRPGPPRSAWSCSRGRRGCRGGCRWCPTCGWTSRHWRRAPAAPTWTQPRWWSWS